MKSMKTLVIDTNVFMYEPNCIETFEDNTIIIPGAVLSELDKKKSTDRNAREAIKKIEEYRVKGNLTDGIKTNSGGILKVEFYKNNISFPEEFKLEEMDNLIIGVALQRKKNFPNEEVEVVSKDINLRIKTESISILHNGNEINVKAKDYRFYKKTKVKNMYDNIVYVDDDVIDKIYQFNEYKYDEKLLNNNNLDYYILKSNINPNKSALVRNYKGKNGKFCLLNENLDKYVFGIRPTNAEQCFLADSLLDKDIDLLFSIGPAGTGKTLLSLAYSLLQVLDGQYKKLIVMRNPAPVGKDIGFIPGSLEDKIHPWMKPIYDNLEFMLYNNIDKKENNKKLSNKDANELTIGLLKDNGILELDATIHTRGRTFNNCIVLIDEAQNMTPHEVKTIITRMGKNCKMIFTGDPDQIDIPYLTSDDNGLVYASSKFMEKSNIPYITTVYLNKTERSKVVEKAIDIL